MNTSNTLLCVVFLVVHKLAASALCESATVADVQVKWRIIVAVVCILVVLVALIGFVGIGVNANRAPWRLDTAL